MSERILDQFEEFELPPFESDGKPSAPRLRHMRKIWKAGQYKSWANTRSPKSRLKRSASQRHLKITLATKA